MDWRPEVILFAPAIHAVFQDVLLGWTELRKEVFAGIKLWISFNLFLHFSGHGNVLLNLLIHQLASFVGIIGKKFVDRSGVLRCYIEAALGCLEITIILSGH